MTWPFNLSKPDQSVRSVNLSIRVEVAISMANFFTSPLASHARYYSTPYLGLSC